MDDAIIAPNTPRPKAYSKISVQGTNYTVIFTVHDHEGKMLGNIWKSGEGTFEKLLPEHHIPDHAPSEDEIFLKDCVRCIAFLAFDAAQRNLVPFLAEHWKDMGVDVWEQIWKDGQLRAAGGKTMEQIRQEAGTLLPKERATGESY